MLEGSLSVFIGTAISISVTLAFNVMLDITALWKIIVIDGVGTIVEACNYKFLDNITLPSIVALLMYLFFAACGIMELIERAWA